ncbi:MAG: sigma-54 dependent transcriptional regulator, partial [Candidatus Marinimicrobia bacterium]|nr:sigma-54 dependent transcriptional regulator [Candidatus Neomarinimicrobiota bacterium]MCF7840746.1 sigma-54 dependent transcriptional regulator [Candidatus Neomarinimicrobiota bacterium]
ILVIDDEKNIRATLTGILEDAGYEVVAVDTAEKGMDALQEQLFDVALVDVKLPGMDGMTFLDVARQLMPDLDIIMISGHSGISTAVQAVKLGAYDFCEKPLSLPKILISIQNLAEKRRLARRSQEFSDNEELRYRMIGDSPALQQLAKMIQRVAQTDAKVLIRGESGTGKELVAHAIHTQSNRRKGAFVKFNSAAIPRELVESELFGYEKGAFTGATKAKPGKLERAHEGTLFLDEIGDMDLSAQAKVLRVIQEGKFERVGSTKTLDINVRLIAATHKPLEEMVRDGSFREDLFYRLNVVPIQVPPLRERVDDIPLLADHFLRELSRELKLGAKTVDEEGLALLKTYSFRGNIRELRNLMERLYILVPQTTIRRNDIVPHLEISGKAMAGDFAFLETKSFQEARQEFETYYLQQQLEKFDGNISRMARSLGLQQSNLSRKLKELGLR